MKIPTHLVTGFLGVGKTTAILHLLAHKPASERWAVLVNEFGQVGIDGATLSASGVAVREVPGGCLCCTAQMPLKVALTRLVREVKPDRLIIEPSGLGHPAGVVDVLREEGLGLAHANVICLVDPRQLRDPRVCGHELFRDQIQLADVLVANKVDLAAAADLAAFETLAHAAYPPKRLVARVEHGRLDLAWLGLAGAAPRLAHVHDPAAFEARGWTHPACACFDPAAVRALFQAWMHQPGLVRAKGVVRVGRDWRLFNLAGGVVDVQTLAYRGDTRIDVVGERGLDWAAVEAQLCAALQNRSWMPL